MDRIVVKVSDLLEKSKELSKDGMKYVELAIDEDDGKMLVMFHACTSKNSLEGVDYEEIYAVDDVVF